MKTKDGGMIRVDPYGEIIPVVAGELPDMSIRDYFAGKALVGLLSSPRPPAVEEITFKGIAHLSYAMADAMLEERGER